MAAAATGIVYTGTVQFQRSNFSIAGGAGTQVLTAGQAQSRFLEFTGAITGNRIITFPLNDGGVWRVFNNTTGAFTVQLIGASGTGAILRQGAYTEVYSDGTNVYRCSVDVKADGSVLQLQDTVQTITYAAAITPNADAGRYVYVNVTSAAMTINAPTNAAAGKSLIFDIANGSGGAITTTWNAVFLKDATGWTDPANTKRRTVQYFCRDGTNWEQVGATSADIT